MSVGMLPPQDTVCNISCCQLYTSVVENCLHQLLQDAYAEHLQLLSTEAAHILHAFDTMAAAAVALT